MRHGKELVLVAMKKELSVLSKKADKAKAECDEAIGIGSEAIRIHEDFAAIVKLKSHSKETMRKLEALQKRQKNVDKVIRKDLVKLMDKEHETRLAVNSLQAEISSMEYYASK